MGWVLADWVSFFAAAWFAFPEEYFTWHRCAGIGLIVLHGIICQGRGRFGERRAG